MRGRAVEALSVALLLALALGLRWHDLDRLPRDLETGDEYAFAWSGWSLRREGVPRAWSWLPAYGDQAERLYWRDHVWPHVSPWLDHPPLYSLLVGLAAELGSPVDWRSFELRWMRLPSIALAGAGGLLLYLLGRAHYGVAVAAVALALYATVPTIVASGRLALSENLLTPLLLLALWLATHAARRPDARLGAAAGLVAGSAALAKATGLAAVAAVALYLAAAGRRREAALAAGLGLGVAALYLLYGLALDRELFARVLHDQASRAGAAGALPRLVLENRITDRVWHDGWILWGWLALGWAAFERRTALVWPVVAYLGVLAVAADPSLLYGWYRIPLHPFLCLAGGLWLVQLARCPTSLPAALWVLGPVAWSLDLAWGLWRWLHTFPLPVSALAAVVGLVLLPYLACDLGLGERARRSARLATLVLLGASLIATAYVSWQLPRHYY